ncbi:MAG TPA: methyltransferase [Pyrinomonadaceae bacterium]|nr:methyltransferase [Pyrinomonadaceae bacterium]
MTTNENAAATAMQPQLPPEANLGQISMGCFLSQAVYVAAKLGIADLLKDKPVHISELAKQTETHERSLYRVLRALASVGVFAETDPKVFSLTPVAEPLITDRPASMRDLVIFMGEKWHWAVYGEMLYSVQTGKAAWEKVHGQEVFPYFQQNPEEYEIFNRAMTSFSHLAAPVAEAYDTTEAETLVDIAGGHGALLSAFLKANPNLNGVLFDLPEVVAGAPALLEKEGVAERGETVSGDFFQAVPPGADVYMMKHIIHDWDDARAVKILSNIRAAMKPDGKVLLIEHVVPQGNTPDMSKMMDLEMLVSPGGVERTAEEYTEILAAAGLRLNRIIPTKSPLSIVEAVKQ